MVEAIRSLEAALDTVETAERRPTDNDLLREVLDELAREVGWKRLEAVLGDGRWRLAPAEAATYHQTNRSIRVIADLPTGTTLTEKQIAILRQEESPGRGLHPRYWQTALGAKTTKPLAAGEGLTWGHLLNSTH